jgi:tricorn protease
MANTTDLSTVDVTSLRFVDFDPQFTVDGKHLAFLSMRSFDPVYDTHVFDMSFPYGTRPHLVPLAATTPSPFSPQLRGRPVDDEPDGKDKDGDDDTTWRASASGWSRCRCRPPGTATCGR